jgi:hypothetical protein
MDVHHELVDGSEQMNYAENSCSVIKLDHEIWKQMCQTCCMYLCDSTVSMYYVMVLLEIVFGYLKMGFEILHKKVVEIVFPFI